MPGRHDNPEMNEILDRPLDQPLTRHGAGHPNQTFKFLFVVFEPLGLRERAERS